MVFVSPIAKRVSKQGFYGTNEFFISYNGVSRFIILSKRDQRRFLNSRFSILGPDEVCLGLFGDGL